jgi:CheY-specific phosphatase CheX
MVEEVRRAAIDAVTKVLEEMFFVLAEAQREKTGGEETAPGENATGEGVSGKWVRGEIGLQGAFSGKILLTLPYRLALTLAANFLGAEEKDISKGELLDAVSELNNMISGNLLSQLNKKAQFSLTRTKTELICDEEKRKLSPEFDLEIPFNADGHRVDLSLQVSQPEQRRS